jgi:hypothetical protein
VVEELGTGRAPLGGEDGEYEFVSLVALEEFGLAEVRLLAHAEATAEDGGEGVAKGGAGEDAMGAEVVEG